MKATVNDLWDTGREIISYDGSEFDRPTVLSDLKKCDNVLIGDKVQGMTEVMIDNCIYMAEVVKVSHPSGGGRMQVIEVY